MNDQAVLECLIRGCTTETELTQALGMSASELHQRIETLQAAGIEIIGRAGEAYTLAHPIELLDAGKILGALSPCTREQLHSLALLFETDSTQIQALNKPAPERGCALWLAERQTAGQGRRGRIWASPLAAHFYLSLSRRFNASFAAMSGLSLVVGIVLAETLRQLGFPQVAVKWPNDLVVDGKKLGGILVQLRGVANGSCEAVIGVGINVRMPSNYAMTIDQPWCDLSQLASGQAISRNELAIALLNDLLPALAAFEIHGLAPFLRRWPALDALCDQWVRVLDGDRTIEGQMLGITDAGALRLLQSDGEHHYHSGEISVRPV